MNIGMIGAGAWATEIAACLGGLRAVRLAGIQNRTREKAEKLAGQFGISRVYESAQELCRSADVDAVIVTTHESAHLEPTLCALQAGKHVFVEKPMADTAKSARLMATAAQEAGRILMPGHLVRFTTHTQETKRQLRDAGPVRAIRCYQHRPKNLYSTYCRPHIALSLMIHHLDLCRWFVGHPVSKVTTVERFHLGKEYPSSVWVTLEFDNGAVGTLQSGWVLEGDSPIFWEDGLEIVTDRQRITIRFNEDYEVRGPAGIQRRDLVYAPALRAELEYWLQCIERGTQPSVVTPEDGIEAVELAERVIAGGRNQ